MIFKKRRNLIFFWDLFPEVTCEEKKEPYLITIWTTSKRLSHDIVASSIYKKEKITISDENGKTVIQYVSQMDYENKDLEQSKLLWRVI